MNTKILLFLSGLLLTGCTTDFFQTEPTIDSDIQKFKGVDERLWSYFEEFEAQAAARGLLIDLKTANVTGLISEIDEDGVLGQCRYSNQRPNEVTVDETFWKRSSTLYREFVVFHELGHCVLDRGHREDKDTANRCLSIMRSGLGDCQDAYSTRNREYYLDELFGIL